MNVQLQEIQSKENKDLAEIIAYESTNLQWTKLILNWGLILILTVFSLMKGSGAEISIIGVMRCDGLDWALFAIL